MMQEGEQFAGFVERGDIFTLSGNLAAGKTTFIKGVAKGLGFQGPVTSPTFTLVNEYQCEPVIIHIDCYREHNLSRWLEIGITEYFHRDAVVFIEWPDRIDQLLPEYAFPMEFRHISENKREIVLR